MALAPASADASAFSTSSRLALGTESTVDPSYGFRTAIFAARRQPTRSRMSDTTARTFQDVILGLQDYWAKQGCVIHQPCDVEVGAGTLNPATFLRALGPEPYRTAYVEPSRRRK